MGKLPVNVGFPLISSKIFAPVLIGPLFPLVGAISENRQYEVATALKASDVIPAELAKGKSHRVEDPVRSDGYLNYYTIQSDFGEFEAANTYASLAGEEQAREVWLLVDNTS